MILTAGSKAGDIGSPRRTRSTAAQWAFCTPSRWGVAIEQAQSGVRVLCFSPGPIDTAWTYANTGALTPEMEATLLDATPLARRGTVEEVANLVAFLANDEAGYMTASIHLVDGSITHGTRAIGRNVPAELRGQPTGELRLEYALQRPWLMRRASLRRLQSKVLAQQPASITFPAGIL